MTMTAALCALHTQGPFNAVIVEEASARLGMDRFIVVDADHISVCKPASKQAQSYVHFSRFLERLKARTVREQLGRRGEVRAG